METIIKLGSRGARAKELQELLRAKGYGIVADGVFGPRSVEALRDFQRAAGLPPTGQGDSNTWARLQDQPTLGTVTPGGFGLWVDSLPDRRGGVWDWDGWAQELVGTGASDFSIVTFGQTVLALPSWWNAERLAAAAAALYHAAGKATQPCRVGWLYWADAQRDAESRETYQRLLERCAKYGSECLPFYLEADAEEAAKGLTPEQAVRWARLHPNVELQVTAVINEGNGLGLARPFIVGNIAERHVVLRPQIYTAYLPNKAWTKHGLFRPGVFQEKIADNLAALLDAYPSLTIEQGAALYGQDHPAPHPKGVEALQASYKAALDTAHMWSPKYGPRWMFWSSKAISSVVYNWLKTLPR